jgi:radical SAM-linked protein
MRTRITFSKTEAMRYTGHLDLHRAWERTFRRAGLPLAYSQGFHPQPRLNLGCALPLGFTSQCELLDAWLEINLPVAEIYLALIKASPPGVQIDTIEEVDAHLPALQTTVTSAEYTITLLDPIPDLNARLVGLETSPRLPRERRGKSYDLRLLIEGISPLPCEATGLQHFQLRLTAREGATGRPEEVLAVLGVPLETTRIHRTKLILSEKVIPAGNGD